MKRVLIVVDNLERGGVSSAVKGFCHAVEANYNDITFDYLVFEEPKDTTINDLNAKGSVVGVIPSVGMHPIRFMHNVDAFLKKHGPYIAIHMHNAYFIWLVAKAAKINGISNRIGHAHGKKGRNNNPIFELLALIGRLKNKEYCTHMFACADSSGKWTFGKNYSFLPNVVPLGTICLEKKENYYEEFQISKSDCIIGYLGVFEPEKNTKFLIDIMEMFPLRGYSCVVAGNGTLYKKVVVRAKKRKQESKIKLVGYRNDGSALLKFFDVLVAPSFSEGMSLTLLEAQLSGTPCVVSERIPKTNDLQLGLYYTVSDFNPYNWKKTIEKAVSDRHNTTLQYRLETLRRLGYDEKSVADKLYEALTKN